jgi:hypothetical protein
MLEVQLAMLGLLILSNIILLIETICIQILLLYKSYYILTPNLNYSLSPNLNFDYEKNYSYINDYHEIMFYV